MAIDSEPRTLRAYETELEICLKGVLADAKTTLAEIRKGPARHRKCIPLLERAIREGSETLGRKPSR